MVRSEGGHMQCLVYAALRWAGQRPHAPRLQSGQARRLVRRRSQTQSVAAGDRQIARHGIGDGRPAIST